MLKSFTILFLVFIVTGCAALRPQPDQVKVNIADIRMMQSSLMEQRYEIKLRVMNRGKQAISIEGMSFDLELNGKDFASGVSNQRLELAPFSEGLVTVNVTSTLFGIFRQIQSIEELKGKPFEYEMSGYIHTRNLFGIPFNNQGEIDLRLPEGSYSQQPVL